MNVLRIYVVVRGHGMRELRGFVNVRKQVERSWEDD